LWTYFAGSYVDGSDDVLWFRDPTGRREVSFVYDPARHRIVDGDVRSFNQDRGLKASAIDDDQYHSHKEKQQERTMSM
jgi:ASC-1-like (ASCH) protein